MQNVCPNSQNTKYGRVTRSRGQVPALSSGQTRALGSLSNMQCITAWTMILRLLEQKPHLSSWLYHIWPYTSLDLICGCSCWLCFISVLLSFTNALPVNKPLPIWCWITSLIYSSVCFQENALSVLSLCCCWVRDSDIFNLPLWSPTAPSCPWMPATSKGGWLWAMEIWGEDFCLLWSFRYPPCKYSCTHTFLITRALWNPIYLRKIKSHSMPGYHKTLLYRNMALLERWAFHPLLIALLGLCLVSDKKKGCWSLILNHRMGPDPAHISFPRASRTAQFLNPCWLPISQAEECVCTC